MGSLSIKCFFVYQRDPAYQNKIRVNLGLADVIYWLYLKYAAQWLSNTKLGSSTVRDAFFNTDAVQYTVAHSGIFGNQNMIDG